MRSSIILGLLWVFLGLSLGLHSIILTQQRLESGSDDSGCVCRIKVCSMPEIFLYCVKTKRVL